MLDVELIAFDQPRDLGAGRVRRIVVAAGIEDHRPVAALVIERDALLKRALPRLQVIDRLFEREQKEPPAGRRRLLLDDGETGDRVKLCAMLREYAPRAGDRRGSSSVFGPTRRC